MALVASEHIAESWGERERGRVTHYVFVKLLIKLSGHYVHTSIVDSYIIDGHPHREHLGCSIRFAALAIRVVTVRKWEVLANTPTQPDKCKGSYGIGSEALVLQVLDFETECSNGRLKEELSAHHILNFFPNSPHKRPRLPEPLDGKLSRSGLECKDTSSNM